MHMHDLKFSNSKQRIVENDIKSGANTIQANVGDTFRGTGFLSKANRLPQDVQALQVR